MRLWLQFRKQQAYEKLSVYLKLLLILQNPPPIKEGNFSECELKHTDLANLFVMSQRDTSLWLMTTTLAQDLFDHLKPPRSQAAGPKKCQNHCS